MSYELSFQNIKVGDVVVYQNGYTAEDLTGLGVVTSVSPTRFKFTYGEGKQSDNKKENGHQFGYRGRQVLHLNTPESKAEYNALMAQQKKDRTENVRQHAVAGQMNTQAAEAGLTGLHVNGYGTFNLRIQANEKQAQDIIDALIQAGIKL